MQNEEALASIPLFAQLTEEQTALIAGRLRRRTYAEREVIVRRDDPGDALFIVTSGKVKISYSDEENETIIAMMSAGEFFGELSILDGEARSADVVALEPTDVLVLSADDFHQCLAVMPGIATGLLRELAGRLRRSTSWIRALSSQDVYGRIAQQLLFLADTHGIEGPDGSRRIPLRLTQNDLAGIIGASRESVNKAVGYFKGKGYISVDNATYHITVHDRPALEKRSRQ